MSILTLEHLLVIVHWKALQKVGIHFHSFGDLHESHFALKMTKKEIKILLQSKILKFTLKSKIDPAFWTFLLLNMPIVSRARIEEIRSVYNELAELNSNCCRCWTFEFALNVEDTLNWCWAKWNLRIIIYIIIIIIII